MLEKDLASHLPYARRCLDRVLTLRSRIECENYEDPDLSHDPRGLLDICRRALSSHFDRTEKSADALRLHPPFGDEVLFRSSLFVAGIASIPTDDSLLRESLLDLYYIRDKITGISRGGKTEAGRIFNYFQQAFRVVVSNNYARFNFWLTTPNAIPMTVGRELWILQDHMMRVEEMVLLKASKNSRHSRPL